MAKIEYELQKMIPRVEVSYSGNPLDPAAVRYSKALGSFGTLPPYIILPGGNPITSVSDAEAVKGAMTRQGVIHSQMPFKVKRPDDTEWFTFPIEPLVSVSGKNSIIRRSVAKGTAGGSVKERWCRDDYTVQIQGVVSLDGNAYPEEQVRTISALFNERRSIEVAQEILLILGIKYLAVESLSFPHTKGVNNQNFSIKAYSDNNSELFISI